LQAHDKKHTNIYFTLVSDFGEQNCHRNNILKQCFRWL